MRSLHPVGGIERTITDKANWLVASGNEVLFVTYNQGSDDIPFHLDSRVMHVDMGCSIFSLYKYSILVRIYKFIKLRSSFRHKFANIIQNFYPDAIAVPIPNAEDFLYDIIKVTNGVRVVIESHVSFDYLLLGKSLTDRLSYIFLSPFRAIRKADMLVALTEHDALNWRQHNVKNVTIIPNPLTFYSDNNGKVPKIEGRIIAVGRLVTQKRFDRLIEAFSMIADAHQMWHIDIFGDGELHKAMNEQIKSLGLVNRVVLHPFTSDIMIEYMRSQFLVLSSDYEGFGLVITEAMACGIPVVSTDCPFGPSDIIENGKTGLLAQMDAGDLAEKIEWMIKNEERRVEMGINAHLYVRRYDKEQIMPLWEQIYMNLSY